MVFVINALSEIGDINKGLSHNRCYSVEIPPVVNQNKLLMNQYQAILL